MKGVIFEEIELFVIVIAQFIIITTNTFHGPTNSTISKFAVLTNKDGKQIDVEEDEETVEGWSGGGEEETRHRSRWKPPLERKRPHEPFPKKAKTSMNSDSP